MALATHVVTLLATALVVLAGASTAAAARSPEPTPVGVWPLSPAPAVLRGFDPPALPWLPGHRGVDLAGHVGQVVGSALPGTVRFVGRIAGRGVVSVDHGATRTTYEPVAASIAVGTLVAAGGPVGRLELTGSHCLPRACLHWGWRRGEVYLDPLLLVGAGPVRLLPLWRDSPAGVASSGWPGRPAWPLMATPDSRPSGGGLAPPAPVPGVELFLVPGLPVPLLLVTPRSSSLAGPRGPP